MLAEWDVGFLPISFLEGGDGGFIILSSWSQVLDIIVRIAEWEG